MIQKIKTTWYKGIDNIFKLFEFDYKTDNQKSYNNKFYQLKKLNK